MEEKTVVAEQGGVRLDAFVAQNFELSRSLAATLIEDGNVLLNGKTAKKKAAKAEKVATAANLGIYG